MDQLLKGGLTIEQMLLAECVVLSVLLVTIWAFRRVRERRRAKGMARGDRSASRTAREATPPAMGLAGTRSDPLGPVVEPAVDPARHPVIERPVPSLFTYQALSGDVALPVALPGATAPPAAAAIAPPAALAPAGELARPVVAAAAPVSVPGAPGVAPAPVVAPVPVPPPPAGIAPATAPSSPPRLTVVPREPGAPVARARPRPRHDADETILSPETLLAKAYGFLAEGAGEEAASQLRLCVRLAAKLKQPGIEANARLELGDLARESGDLTTACEHWQMARALFTTLRREPDMRAAEQRMERARCPSDWVLNQF